MLLSKVVCGASAALVALAFTATAAGAQDGPMQRNPVYYGRFVAPLNSGDQIGAPPPAAVPAPPASEATEIPDGLINVGPPGSPHYVTDPSARGGACCSSNYTKEPMPDFLQR
jgi:hypothetical protein